MRVGLLLEPSGFTDLLKAGEIHMRREITLTEILQDMIISFVIAVATDRARVALGRIEFLMI